jgi:hypothetical protein
MLVSVSNREKTMAGHEAAIQKMLEQFAKAFTSGDGTGAAACWEVPALVVSPEGNRGVSSLDEVAQFFGGAQAQYHAQGVTGTRPEVRKTEWLTPEIATVTVRWPYLDAKGESVGRAESSVYLVRIREGAAKIFGAVLAGEERR